MSDTLAVFDTATHSPTCVCSTCRVARRNGWDPTRIIADWDARPADCRCVFRGQPGDGQHTATVSESISDESLARLIVMVEDEVLTGTGCPAEVRALIRCLERRSL